MLAKILVVTVMLIIATSCAINPQPAGDRVILTKRPPADSSSFMIDGLR